MKKFGKREKIVLVGVLKNERDLRLLLREHWYRMPVAHAPVRACSHIAFYQPAAFGGEGRRIKYFAKISSYRIFRRSHLLPHERKHARACDMYVRVGFRRIQKLSCPVRNTAPRRVVFGFTTLRALRSFRNMLQLFSVPPTETIVGRLLRHLHVRALPQKYVHCGSRMFRLDFAVFCKEKKIAIECDNTKAHAGAVQQERDRQKDMLLKRHGWIVLRFDEKNMTDDLKSCARIIRKTISGAGGQA